MDWLTFIVRIVETLVWPIVVGLIAWTQRAPLGRLIDKLRLRSLKWGDAEATFGEELDRIEETIAPPLATGVRELQEITAKAAQLPPAYIVQQAWSRLEQAINEATKGRFAELPTDRGGASSRTGARMVNYARRVEALELSPDDAELLRQLRNLRNLAVHSSEPNITVTDALRYNDFAEALARRIEGTRS